MTGDRRVQLLPTAPDGLEVLPLLAGPEHATALVHPGGVVTFGELRGRVETRRRELGNVRRLVLLEAAHEADSVVTYLAALAGRHPVLLLGPGELERSHHLLTTYKPDVVHDSSGLRELHPGTTHELHPDLALLLSTSGSTGSPKMVRLSLENLVANARSIADYLSVRPTDRAITSLPLHYCYGLSVLNSHLLVGAGVVLSDLSVADECFWSLVREHGVTSLSGVPHTFDLLEASGFARRDVPSLRYLTQAGGRMDPSRVRGLAELGRRRGFDLFVMYGQTEATARMAYVPSDLVASRPEAIGVAIPGGRLDLEPVAGLPEGVGELVYEGPNVMLGYAERPADLALGRTVTRLHTGDLGRRGADGLLEVVGRRNRTAKVFGLRVDLDRVERLLAERGLDARVVADDERLCAFVDRPRVVARVRAALGEITTLPPGALLVERLEELPLTATGKPDRATLTRHLERLPVGSGHQASPATASPDAVRDLYAVLLGRPEASTEDSFAALGGDSLSYVEVSVRLSAMLGELPAGWAHLTPTALAATATRPRRFVVRVDASALLRAIAILLVLLTHADLVQVAGGAHVLLAVAGYNLARFQLGLTDRATRIRGVLQGAWRVALPAFCWIGAVAAATSAYDTSTMFLLNGFLGRETWDDNWQFWFIEAVVLGYLALAVLLAVPALDRWQRRTPYASALVVLGGTLALRYLTVGVEAGPTERYSAAVVLWCVALGWAAAAARGPLQHLLVGVLAVAATTGFFADGRREAIVVLGLLVLLLDRPVPLLRPVGVAVGMVSAASLWIYLTHWQVYPPLEDAGHPYLAVLASLAVGIAAHGLYTRLGVMGRGLVGRSIRTLRAPAVLRG